jgi:hypothetical protein
VKKKSGSHPLHCNLYIRGALVSQPLSSYTWNRILFLNMCNWVTGSDHLLVRTYYYPYLFFICVLYLHVQESECLRPLEHWDRGFQTHSRHGCQCCHVWVATLRRLPSKETYRLSKIKKLKWNASWSNRLLIDI